MADVPGSDLSIRLGDLDDVNRGNPQPGDTLLFDGANWVPGAPSAGGLNSVWVPGSAFVGDANGFGSPGGAGEYAAMIYPAGQNRYAIASIIIPIEWPSFQVFLFLSSTDADTQHRYLLEGNWGLFGAGDTLNGDLNPFITDIQNAGSGALALGTAIQEVDNSDGYDFFQLKIRSNNATNEIAGETHLIGALLRLI